MTDIEIIKTAIDKAIRNGFNFGDNEEGRNDKEWFEGRDWDVNTPYYLNKTEYYNVIFSHDFAKAFWKNEKPVMVKLTYANGNSVEGEWEAWQIYLSQLAIADDPIEYLSRFLLNGE